MISLQLKKYISGVLLMLLKWRNLTWHDSFDNNSKYLTRLFRERLLNFSE